MDRPIDIAPASAVRAAIARIILGDDHSEPPLGAIQLKPHQESSILRLEGALGEFGGALLCDEVGMGKTFVALAIARRYQRCLIVGPAGLKAMWLDALARAEMEADFLTFESLSRNEPPPVSPDLLIVDESHHARNRSTRRYARIGRLARSSRVLLLTATPVHNRRADLVAMLSLFLGSRSHNLSERELSQCVVRRERAHAAGSSGIPEARPGRAYEIRDDPGIVEQIMKLPSPLPARDGETGGVLINRGLVHQWSSSHAAFRDALLRRLAKATALIASLEQGRYPSAAELESWTFAEGALQLGFAELLSPPTSDAAELLRSVSAHVEALEGLRDYGDRLLLDDARAAALSDIRRENPGARIVAFAQYAATVSALYRRLARAGGVASLTATGARVAGGKLCRKDAIARFAPIANHAPRPSAAESIDLLLATDLLSEGVNLQDAEVVVHLDVPWTAARMEQRVGRVARMGSRHRLVKVYRLRPPPSAETILRGEAVVSAKFEIARGLVGGSSVHPLVANDSKSFRTSIPSHVEKLRATLRRWTDRDSPRPIKVGQLLVGAASAGRSGFIAAAYLGGAPILLSSLSGALSTDLEAQIASCSAAEGPDSSVDRADYETALQAIHIWAEGYQAAESSGAATAGPAGRQRLISRIDSAVQRAPPHLRASRARTVAAARQIAGATHGVAVEQDLQELALSTLPDDEWLSAVASVVQRDKHMPADRHDFRLIALLLLRP